MKIDGIIYFAPDHPYMDLDWTNPRKMFDAFRSRIDGYYLKPAKHSLRNGDLFVAQLIGVCAIEAVMRVMKEMDPEVLKLRKQFEEDNNINDWKYKQTFNVGKVEWKKYFGKRYDLDDSQISDFYENIRCGLVHEGRIKENKVLEAFGEGNYKRPMVENEGTVFTHPKYLLECVPSFISTIMENDNGDNGFELCCALQRIFRSEINAYSDGEGHDLKSPLPVFIKV